MNGVYVEIFNGGSPWVLPVGQLREKLKRSLTAEWLGRGMPIPEWEMERVVDVYMELVDKGLPVRFPGKEYKKLIRGEP